MALESFRSEYRARHSGYRTPSPPRLAVEPLSSPGIWTSTPKDVLKHPNNRKRKLSTYTHDQSEPRHFDAFSARIQHAPNYTGPAPIDTKFPSQPNGGPSALDVFAAVATSPSLAHDLKSPLHTYGSSVGLTSTLQSASRPPFERASKRTRSELVGFRPAVTDYQRPITSYVGTNDWHDRMLNGAISNNATVQVDERPALSNRIATSDDNDVLKQDAELLLMFARGSYDERQPTTKSDILSLVASQQLPAEKTVGNVSRKYDDSPQKINSRAAADSSRPSAPDTTAPHEAIGPTLGAHHEVSTSHTPQSDPSKPREHRGWPKGKPRGPRAPGAVRKKRSDAGAKKGEPKRRETRTGRKKGKDNQGVEGTAPLQTDNADDAFNNASATKQRRRNSLSHTTSSLPKAEQYSVPPRSASAPPDLGASAIVAFGIALKQREKSKKVGHMPQQVEFCPACQLRRNKINGFQDLWINCNGCKTWIHATCAGFDTEKKVKEVDKFYCKKCETNHGSTTYVRKSSRAHASVDYAGLHEGKVRTAVDIPDHHYIDPIKAGTIQFQPETFPRIPPELVTADYFAKCGGWTEPILIPAALNPRPSVSENIGSGPEVPVPASKNEQKLDTEGDGHFNIDYDYDLVTDDGQDKLDMVIPHGLTVRRAAELYGPEEKVDVIDVKLQEGEDRRWTMRQWADYYEAEGEKPVRNVISLEVSQSPLGRLIRRPKVVRDMDLQDAVWPEEETAKGVFPRVQFYCLMSVADCYTDFHIDFGGSSVYYHILKGRKTFFFIPPKPKYLKKYEDWCNSPDQNSVFLGNETKECYRVDLYPGDTMLIPSGWIHAVWTPENSLVIGGNFLTRMNYGMQIQVNDIEKATNVTRKFRYPYFQKILWLTAVQYLQRDPIPSTVVETLCGGGHFERKRPVWHEFENDDDYASTTPESYNARYYPQGEMQGLPDLIRYLQRTVMISLGKVPGVSKSTQDAVTRSMPKHCGSHVDLIRTFAMWSAWKCGNEEIPAWAYPDAPLVELDAGSSEKKFSAAAQRRIERQAMHEAHKAASDRRSLRAPKDEARANTPTTSTPLVDDKQPRSPTDIRRIACDDCRRRRRRCSHNISASEAQVIPEPTGPRFGVKVIVRSPPPSAKLPENIADGETIIKAEPLMEQSVGVLINAKAPALPEDESLAPGTIVQLASEPISTSQPHFEGGWSSPSLADQDSLANMKRSKNRACLECRRSKRRCVHDENGSIDLVKAQETPIPRMQAATKRPRNEDEYRDLDSGKKIKTDADQSPHTNDSLIKPSFPYARVSPDVPLLGPDSNPRTYDEPLIAPDDGLVSINHSVIQNGLPISNGDAAIAPNPRVAGTDIVVSSGAGLRAPDEDIPMTDAEPSYMMGEAATVIPADQPVTTISDSRSRTPSSNQQTTSSENARTSPSPPTSPLTELESSPKVASIESNSVNALYQGSKEIRDPSSRTGSGSRSSHQQGRLNDLSAGQSSFAKPTGIAKKRSASRSVSGELGASGSRVSKSPSKKSPSQTRLLTPAEAEEAESLKLARMLAVEDYSLRRRRS